jgi:hypothetical protein
MSNPITALNGVHQLDLSNLRPHETAAVFVQGSANDFVWSIQAKASDAASFVDLPSATGITGANVKEFRPCRDVTYQVKVTNMGTATAVYVRTN